VALVNIFTIIAICDRFTFLRTYAKTVVIALVRSQTSCRNPGFYA